MAHINKTILAGGLALLSFVAPAQAATYNFDGTILEFARGGTSIDLFAVNAAVDGNYIFDVLSRRVLPGGYVGMTSGLDSQLFLFGFDPLGDQGQLGALVGENNDGGVAGVGDGSISFLDSYLDIFLTAGNYVLGIGDYNLTEADVRNGLNGNDSLLGGIAQYQISVTAPDTPDLGVIPLPASLPLLAAAFGGFALLRRKRKQAG